MTGALRSEWTKLRTDNGTAWILAAICALTVAVGAATAAVTRCGGGAGCAVDPTRVSLTGIEVGQAVVAVLAVLVISGEYSTGMIRVTLTATVSTLAEARIPALPGTVRSLVHSARSAPGSSS